jgi:acyl carrier protein
MQAKFIDLIKEVFEIEDANLDINVFFRDLDSWDSLTHLSLIAMIDEEYGVVIEDDIFKTLMTLNDLFEEIQKRQV